MMRMAYDFFFGIFNTNPAPPVCYTLSCGGIGGDVFGIHGDKVVYDDGAHCEGTEGVGEGVQSIVGHCSE